ncbi:MAG: DNA cytosine methyltransferase, partial [Desulfonatronovibrio sp.]
KPCMSTQTSIQDASASLGISCQRVRELCRSGEIDSKKIGGTWILSSDSVDRYGLKTSHTVAQDHPVIKRRGTSSKPIALSFFSGAMGLDLGMEKAGFDIRLACEFDKYCRQTIALNKPNTALLGDIMEYTPDDVLKASGLSREDDVDVMVGGPPCQAFSTAGKRQAFKDDRGNVFLKYIDLALDIRPKVIVIENVRGLLSCPMEHRPHNQRGEGFPDLSKDELKGGALNFVLSRLEQAGYGVSFNLYNSANFGTPQVRERVILVCSRDGQIPPFLEPTHSEDGAFDLPKWRTFRACVSNIRQHHHLNFPEKRLRYYRLLGPGQNWKALPEGLQKEAMGQSYYAGGGKTGFLRRLAWDKPSPTLVTHPAMPATDLAHPEEDRPLSVEEYKKIQEFPDSWELAGPLIQQYKQLGNAVPIGLGAAVGRLVKKLLEDESVEAFTGFKYSRYRNTSYSDWKKQFEAQIGKYHAAMQSSLDLV